VRLNELNVLADRYLERICQGDDKQFQNLLSACIPFFLSFRKKYGFSHIPLDDVKEELAAEAINRAFMRHKINNKRFSFYLINAFRDCCRERTRIENSERIDKIIDKHGLQFALNAGRSKQPIPPEVQAQRSEFVEQVCLILKDHPSFSKKLVFERTRGSTYPEMATIYRKSLNECKRVYQYDIYHIRKNINPDHYDETQINS
jgi:hypothetical protein